MHPPLSIYETKARPGSAVLWDSQREQMLNRQIALELYNFSVYEELSCFFAHGSKGYTNLAAHFRGEADEELKHSRMFMDYQLQRGGKVRFLSSPEGNIDHKLDQDGFGPIDAYMLALELEKATYVALLEIHNNSNNDPHLQDFIENVLEEQLETQKKINDIIRRLETGGSTASYIHETLELGGVSKSG